MQRALVAIFILSLTGEVFRAAPRDAVDREPAARTNAVLWKDPGAVESRDLRYGPGAAGRRPQPPFLFVEEDNGGHSPKFLVRDARGTSWVVKIGPEAQAETVATRLLWAIGYFADEAYYLPRVRVRRMPSLSRGDEYVQKGIVLGARFEPVRVNETRGGPWRWKDNPFVGTRELDGLRVMMALLNNWDARDDNNEIVFVGQGNRREARFLVADLGATLGRTGGKGQHSKNDVADFVSSEFVEQVEDGVVRFDYDTRPSGWALVTIVYRPYFIREFTRESQFDQAPARHARWVGSLLSRLSARQLHDAFDAAGYQPATRNAYVRHMRQRIGQLVARIR